MPSQQPPHLLATPKLGLERDRDSIASSAPPPDWTLSTASATLTAAAGPGTASPTSTSSGASIGSAATASSTTSPSRNRRGSSSVGASSTSSASSLLGSYSSAHMPSPSTLPSHMPSSFQPASASPDPGHSAAGSDYTTRPAHPSRSLSARAHDTIEHRCPGHPASTCLDRQSFLERPPTSLQQAQTPYVSTRSTHQPDQPSHNRDNLATPLPRRLQRTRSSQSRSRVHTPSVQLALANPTLSKSLCSSPAPSRAGSEQDQQAHAKYAFERNVRRYYYQLTVGCQLGNCPNRLCRSSNCSPRMTKDAAAILSIQLAARPRLFFCVNCPLDPPIHLPGSPLPSTRSPNEASPSLQRKRSLSSKTITGKTISTTASSKSSHGPAASVEDFGRVRDNRLYDPNEYSKSVPSFSVTHIISPMKTTRSSASTSFHNKNENPAIAQLTPLQQERVGTPLFRSLLSVSPFSTMFAPETPLSSSSSNRGGFRKCQEQPKRRAASPSQRVSKSSATGQFDRLSGSTRNDPLLSPTTSTEMAKLNGGFQPPHHRRSFSPSRTRPMMSLATATDIETRGTFRIHPSLRADDAPSPCREHQLAGGATPILRQDSVGLGYTSRMLHPQSMLALSPYYRASTRDEKSALVPDHEPKHKRRLSPGDCGSSTARPTFGSSKDPDSDGVESYSSTDDEHVGAADDSWTQAHFDDQAQRGRRNRHDFSAPSTGELDESLLDSFVDTGFGSRSSHANSQDSPQTRFEGSVNSDGEGLFDRRWLSQNHGSASSSQYSTSSSSRRSSVSEHEDTGVVLPYLNLALLRQAIATYNSSKLGDSPQSPQLLICKGFQPNKALGMRSFESGPGHGSSRFGYSYGMDAGCEEAETHDLKGLCLGDDDCNRSGIVLEYQTIAAGKPVFSEDENHQYGLEVSTEGGRSSRLDPHSNCEASVHEAFSSLSASGHDDEFTGSRFGSPAHSMISSSTYSGEGDSTFLVDSLQAVFSSATALGSSFLMQDRENGSESPDESSQGGPNVGGIDLEALRECYEMMIELKPRTIFAIQVTNSIEILLARLELEQELAVGGKVWTDQEMRAIIILLMNPFLFEQPYQESLLRRILLLFTALSETGTLTQWLSCLDEEGMAQLVTLFKMYLSGHFTPRPGVPTHPAICAVNALGILYEANNIGARRQQERQRRSAIKDARDGKHTVVAESASTISFKYFYSGVMEALKFKDEYQIWREGWNKSPADKVFSYFDYPFLLSPTSKSHIINLDALTQMSAHYEDACVRHALADHAQRLLPEAMTASARAFQKGIRAGSSPYLVLELRRAHLVEEAFEQITRKHADLKKPLKVAFVDVGEEGMDQGGVTKEFFQIMVEKVFDSHFGLFTELEEGRCWWFEGVLDGSSHVEMTEKDIRIRLVEYELVGILVGLALYNGVILGVRFPTVVYRKLLGWEIGLDSFIESFPALGHGLEQMLTWTDGDVYDVFMREFEISYEHLGQVTTLPMAPGGQDIPVTNANRDDYVRAYMDHYVNQHIHLEFEAFQRGFDKICGGKALKLLRPEELELLLCGNSDLDMHDLEASCLYDDGYSPSHTLIKEFWEIVHEDLSPTQHKHLLVFVTGSDRVPIRGLKDLMFVIQRNGPDSDRLPTALTCFSRLLLPEYSSKDKMKERLVTAIENSNGFGLV